MPDSEKFVEGVSKDKIQSRIEHYNEILNSDTYDKTSTEYIYAQDVIEEITNLLQKAEDGRSFVNSIDIQNRIESYLKSLEYIDKDYLESKKEELESKVGGLDITSPKSVEPSEQSAEDLMAEIRRIINLEVEPPTLEEIEDWKSSRPKAPVEVKEELEDIEKAMQALEGRDADDLELQKRVTKNRIQELQDIDKQKELFKITDKGEVVVEYPDIAPEPDVEAAKKEYEYRKQDMVDKFYGNKEKEKLYRTTMDRMKSHIVSKEFEYKAEDGSSKVGEYYTLKEYDGMEEDLKLLQLEEYAERLERVSKAKAGDKSVYENVQIRGKDGKFIKLSPKQAREEDEQYIETNNNAYNKLTATKQNLRTFGKYGEKVPYSEFQKGQPVRNIVRAVGNVAKFIRNNTTARINRGFGAIVSPIYGKITGADHKVKGLYKNKMSHRYVARREYYKSQGKGFFSSRFNSIFHAKEGNKALLSAGACDIYESIKQKYVQEGERQAFDKKTEFASKSVEEQIAMLKTDMETADDTAKAKLQATLSDLEKAKAQIAADKLANQRIGAIQTIQTDAIDLAVHDKANKENVTRTITGIKLATRLGFTKLVGPKIKEWLLARRQKTVEVPKTLEQYQAENATLAGSPNMTATQEKLESALNLPDRKWVETTYKEEIVPQFETRLNTDATMTDIMSSNAGKQIEGYYSVWGGEKRPAMYDLTGNEKITAIFEAKENGGIGLSDTAGLRAPTLTDGTFASELLDANGVLNQDTTISQILEAIENGSMKAEELSNVYVGVSDRYWTKLSDLVEGLTQEVQIGETVEKVVDQAGGWIPLSVAERTEQINKALLEAAGSPLKRPMLQSIFGTTTKVVPNPRIEKVLAGMDIAGKGVGGALLADDIYENTRKTRSKYEPTKASERAYNADAGFTGKRKEDIKTSRSRDER